MDVALDRGCWRKPPGMRQNYGRTHAGCHSGRGAVSVSALQGATRTVPIVFVAVPDRVAPFRQEAWPGRAA